MLASGSGDATVKLWSFEQQRCVTTLTGHAGAVWACAFHYGGEFIASGSQDQSARLWDVATSKCRQSFRCGTESHKPEALVDIFHS